MLSFLTELWRDWTGDRYLEQAIRAELRKQGYAVHQASIRDVRLAAIERPGWVQICKFYVETTPNPQHEGRMQQLLLHGLSRDDGRRRGIDVLLTEDVAVRQRQFQVWSEGMIRRG